MSSNKKVGCIWMHRCEWVQTREDKKYSVNDYNWWVQHFKQNW